MDNDYLIIGRPMMAEIVGVTTGGLQQMEHRGFPVWAKKGLKIAYHLPTVVRWLKMDWERRHRASTTDDPTTAFDVRRKSAEARKAELEVGKLEEAMISVVLVRQGLQSMAINQRTILMSLPGQIGRDIDDPAYRVRAVANAERCVREALGILAAYDPVLDHDDESSAAREEVDPGDVFPDHAPSQVDHQPVGRTKAVSQPRRRRVRAVAQ